MSDSQPRMHAVVFDRYGSTDVLEVREIPRPQPKLAELLIKVCAASVNPKDTFVRKGRFKRLTGKRFPIQSGYDFAGVVAASAHAKLPPGTEVFGMVNGWRGRSAAEYLVCGPDEVAPAPKTIPLEQAAVLPIAALTALQALRDHIQVKPGQRVFINGASGGVGSYAVQIARAMGATVTAMASAASADRCRALGANEVFDYAKGKLPLEGRFDGVFDVFGNLSAKLVGPLLAKRGVYVTTVPSMANVLSAMASLLRAQRSRLVVVKCTAYDLGVLAGMVDRGALKIDIDARYGLNQIRDAHRHVERKHTQGKVLVVV